MTLFTILAILATLSLMYLSRGLWLAIARLLRDPWVAIPLLGLAGLFALFAILYLFAVWREWQYFGIS